MISNKLAIAGAMLLLHCMLQGCATLSGLSTPASGPSSGSADKADTKAAPMPGNDRAARKISVAIGEEVRDFTITHQEGIEAPTGYDGTQYTVRTNGGKTYKCEILEPSGVGKFFTWGMASGASAMCTDFTKGSKDKGKTNKASCNALLQAAGKC